MDCAERLMGGLFDCYPVSLPLDAVAKIGPIDGHLRDVSTSASGRALSEISRVVHDPSGDALQLVGQHGLPRSAGCHS